MTRKKTPPQAPHFTQLFRNQPSGVNLDGSPIVKSAVQLELEAVRAEKQALLEKIELPHLYGWKWYSWAAEFRESTNKVSLLCAANQISKSSTQIRKCILWATDQELWPALWAAKPVQFWYLYPTQKQVNAEFETKWKLFLPKGSMKDDPYYGWKLEKDNATVVAIHFFSGVHVYFKTYEQSTQALQTGTCDAVFCDEELPIGHFDELMFRVSASDGYFHMVFTATLGQDFWRRAMEPEEGEKEELPDAFKKTVSLYDAQYYEDGSPSHWTTEKIVAIEQLCSTPEEIQKRVFGKFIVIGGRKYESFNIKKHMKPKHSVPPGWLIYTGADIGSGGTENTSTGHKSALCFVAVSPDYKRGRVFLGWRGDNEITTAGDVVNKYISMKDDNKLGSNGRYYDWASKDFDTISTRAGVPFEKADKSHETGEQVLNTLFKHNMLFIYEDPELRKLAGELATLKKNENKRRAKDDFADALRYAVTRIPWDWSVITTTVQGEIENKTDSELTPMQREIAERRRAFEGDNESEKQRIQDEFDEANESYG